MPASQAFYEVFWPGVNWIDKATFGYFWKVSFTKAHLRLAGVIGVVIVCSEKSDLFVFCAQNAMGFQLI